MSQSKQEQRSVQIMDELARHLKTFLVKHPELTGLVAVGVYRSAERYVMAAQRGDNQEPDDVPWTMPVVQDCLCEGIGWVRALAAQERLKRLQPKGTHTAPKRVN